MTQEGRWAVFFIDGLEHESFVYVGMCLYGGERRLWGSVFTSWVSQERGAFLRIPDLSNLTFNLCVLDSIRDCRHRSLKRKEQRI